MNFHKRASVDEAQETKLTRGSQNSMKDRSEYSAYGGPSWSPREKSIKEELGSIWGACGINSEWAPLRRVLLHRPGKEMQGIEDPDKLQMLDIPDADLMVHQHNSIALAYKEAGVEVEYINPRETPPPNQIFVADLMFMTPEGAVVGRPASKVRAGEECYLAAALARIGVPILRTVRGHGTFEGADAMWVNSDLVMIGRGLRTNDEGAQQVVGLATEIGVDSIVVDLLPTSMHLMGEIRVVRKDIAICRTDMVPPEAVSVLKDNGYNVHFTPDKEEAMKGMSLNFVTLGPMKILMVAGNLISQAYFEELGIMCESIEMNELMKAAGAVGCLSGVIQRELV
jgi:N-dimethylarginine dimethylaminohydrolase